MKVEKKYEPIMLYETNSDCAYIILQPSYCNLSFY